MDFGYIALTTLSGSHLILSRAKNYHKHRMTSVSPAKDRDAKDRDAKDRDAKDRDAKDRSREIERERERGGPHAVQLPQGGRTLDRCCPPGGGGVVIPFFSGE